MIDMIVCITSKGPSPDDMVEERFGRAPFFIFFDSENDEWNAVENAAAGAAGGAGPRAAQALIDNGDKAVITGNVGGNALAALQAAGIAIYFFRGEGTVKSVYQQYKEGKLTRS
ncbi:MAG TPA: NifB/NifX family molybdenum-iron cluster-binding protein [Methanoregulaceae archaeon]|nr:NifB/NifX family molybdenum-iron cluster-binding protein [Methanoregulaceae archaeon]